MKKRGFWFCEAANLICWGRIIIGGIMMFVRPKLIFAALYSLALISDLFDGWMYRKLLPSEQPKHWFNRLPISLDPIADFVFVAGGIVHVSGDNRLRGVLMALALMAFVVIWQVVAHHKSVMTYNWMMLGLTYGWYLSMCIMLVVVWSCTLPTWFAFTGILLTEAVFYICYFTIGQKKVILSDGGEKDARNDFSHCGDSDDA